MCHYCLNQYEGDFYQWESINPSPYKDSTVCQKKERIPFEEHLKEKELVLQGHDE